MILTGPEIIRQVMLGRIKITPFELSQIGPNSYDLTLGNSLAEYVSDNKQPIDSRKENKIEKYEIPECGLMLSPGRFYLGHTLETTGSAHYTPMIQGRSSIARLGIHTHLSAGFGDLNWFGQWTLELAVVIPVIIYPNMRICQIYFTAMKGKLSGYTGKYQDQQGPTPSRINLDKTVKTEFPLLVPDDTMLAWWLELPPQKFAYVPWDRDYAVGEKGDIVFSNGHITTIVHPNSGEVKIGKQKISVSTLVAIAFNGPIK